jgi:hypothetical protein
MYLLDRLKAASTSESDLSEFIHDNINLIYDFFFNQSYTTFKSIKSGVRDYIKNHLHVINSLDLSIIENRNFVNIILEISERYGFLFSFQRLFSLFKNSHVEITSRLKAAALFLIGVKKSADFESRLIPILEELSVAYDTEEDNKDNVVHTFINYYALVLDSFGKYNIEAVQRVKNKIIEHKESGKYYFLEHDVITKTLSISLDSSRFDEDYDRIQNWLDEFLQKDKFSLDDFVSGEHLIEEEDTHYSIAVMAAPADFESIKGLSADLYNSMPDTDTHFHSLRRGVEVLTEEEQLIVYLRSYGNMHKAKLQGAIDHLPKIAFKENVNVVDWGCGQGIASVIFSDTLRQLSDINNVKSHTLIEPSIIAIKRAALHLNRYGYTRVRTINKDLDSLTDNDLRHITTNQYLTMHLFSNIIDIDLFSLTQLIQNIEKHFKGTNYIIVCSPYINDYKTNRIDSFIRHFEEKFDFTEYCSINNKSGTWEKSWSRVIRVFKVVID